MKQVPQDQYSNGRQFDALAPITFFSDDGQLKGLRLSDALRMQSTNSALDFLADAGAEFSLSRYSQKITYRLQVRLFGLHAFVTALSAQ